MKNKAIQTAIVAVTLALFSASVFATGDYQPRPHHKKKQEVGAFVDDGLWQKSQWVHHKSDKQTNKATLGGEGEYNVDSPFAGATGNVGLNIASGEGNQQANTTTISVGMGKLAKVKGQADQALKDAKFDSWGQRNYASIGGNAFAGATGNIGVNVAAGSSNKQMNITRISSVKPLVGLNCTECNGAGSSPPPMGY